MRPCLTLNRWFITRGGCFGLLGLPALLAWATPAHEVRSLYVEPRRPPRVQLAPAVILLIVATDSIPSGEVTVVRDDRVGHLLGDESTETVLGRVAVT